MVSKSELKEIDIKSGMCYYFDEIIWDLDIEFENVLLDGKSYKNIYENILIYMAFHTKLLWMQNH